MLAVEIEPRRIEVGAVNEYLEVIWGISVVRVSLPEITYGNVVKYARCHPTIIDDERGACSM